MELAARASGESKFNKKAMKKGLIQDRLDILKCADLFVLEAVENKVRQENLIRWAQDDTPRPLRPDTTEYMGECFATNCWRLISACTP